MKSAPQEMGGGRVVLITRIDERHRHTGNCRQIVGGVVRGPAQALAICKVGSSYYLYGCDEEWNVVTDTWHETLEDAMDQAEFEYEGISSTWRKP